MCLKITDRTIVLGLLSVDKDNISTKCLQLSNGLILNSCQLAIAKISEFLQQGND